MAGGAGSRLWPLSRAGHPKQFLALNGKATMLQETIGRLNCLEIDSSVTICNEDHRFLVAEQLREIDCLSSIILEPVGRNTAPAIAIASLMTDGDPLMLVLAADHIIKCEDAFAKAISDAVPLAEAGNLVAFGIIPTEPNTGFGYIKKGRDVGSGFSIEEFVEKPSAEKARHYLSSREYMWNSGMFLFKTSRFLEELKKFRPDIMEVCQASVQAAEFEGDFVRVNRTIFSECPSESVDYAVMERTANAVVVPMNVEWSDIGSWRSLWDISKKNPAGNVSFGDVILHETQNTFVRTEGSLVAGVGLDDLIVVATNDAILVSHKDKVQEVKVIVEKLKYHDRSEFKTHREVLRPWGKYESISFGERYQAKRITINPGAQLSARVHDHLADHWVVVSGSAKVTKGDETFLLSENQSTSISIGIVHALENPGKSPLEIIEIQSGSFREGMISLE